MLDPGAFLALLGPWVYAGVLVVVLADGLPVLGPLVPGHVLLVAAGLAAEVGTLDLVLLAGVAFAGAFAGDLAAFALSRRYGPAFVRRLPRRVRAGVGVAERAVARSLPLSLTLGRQSGVLRALATPVAGAAGVTWRRFLPWSVLGNAFWCGKALGLGWLVGLGL